MLTILLMFVIVVLLAVSVCFTRRYRQKLTRLDSIIDEQRFTIVSLTEMKQAQHVRLWNMISRLKAEKIVLNRTIANMTVSLETLADELDAARIHHAKTVLGGTMLPDEPNATPADLLVHVEHTN